MNINRDYLIINDVKKSNVKLDNGSMFFYITDKNTQNIFVNLVINVSNNELIQKYANIENAEDYTLTMNIVKPSNTYKIVEGKLHDKEKAIFEFNLNEDCCDEVGTYRCELLTKCNINGHEEITTSNKLTYKVKSSVLNDLDEIVEAPEYPLVIQLFDKLSDIEQYEEDRRANELARQLAEEQRQARFNTLDNDMTNSIQAIDNKVVDVENRMSAKEEVVDKLVADTKADIDEYKTAKDTEIDEYKTAKDTEINEAITAQDNKIDTAISEQNDRITLVENNVAAQNNRLDIVENRNAQQDNRLTAIEAKNVEQDNRLNEIETIDVAQNTRLDAIEVKNQQQDDRLLDIEKVNKRQDMNLKCLFAESKNNMIDVTEEGNSIYLQNSTTGYTLIDEIKGNTLVNCNKEPDKELILNGNINTSGDNTVTLTEGVDGGLVDVALEGNTLVNVSKTKDSTAITKAYTVENSGNHVVLQGDADGSCRPVITGNTLVDSINLVETINHGTVSPEYNRYDIHLRDVKQNCDYTVMCKVDFVGSNKTEIGWIINEAWAGKLPDNSIIKGFNKLKITNTSGSSQIRIKLSSNNEITISDIIILEGDYTDKPIPDSLESLQSTFEDNLVTQEMVDSGEEVADNLGKYRVNYKSTREDSTVGNTKTLYLNSPLLEGDTIEEKDGGIYHVHRSELVAYTEGDEAPLITDKVNTLHGLETPQYELIEQSNLIIPSYANGHLDFNTAIPVEKVDFLPFSEELTYLYANTQYTVQFMSDRAVTADITLGGTPLLAQNIVTGLNRISITTPSELIDNKLVINGVGANISEVVVTDTDREFDYFEGMKSVGECEELEVMSGNENLFDVNAYPFINGFTYNYATGDKMFKTSTTTADMIPIKPNTVYSYNCFIEDKTIISEVALYYFDKDKKYIRRDVEVRDDSRNNIITPDNAKYVSITLMSNNTFLDGSKVTLVYGNTIPDSYIPHQSNIQKLAHEPLRGIGDYRDRYVLVDGKWYIERKCGIRAYQEGDKGNYKTDLINTVYPLEMPAYDEIDYNPLEVYSDVTHISTNSTIPCNIIVKNHGFNCLLKPSTTYTISSNLGLNTVTTPSALTEDCLRFIDTDTSDVTTMKDVLVLEGDWTTKADSIPSNFSGIESAFEQEYDAEKGKYKVNIKVANEDKSKENNITFYINEPLRGVGDAKDRVFIKDDKIVVERKCGGVTLDGSDDEYWAKYSNNTSEYDTTDKTSIFLTSIIGKKAGFKTSCCDNFSNCGDYSAYDIHSCRHGIYSDHTTDNIYIDFGYNNSYRVSDFKQWLSENPTTVVYQLAEPVYEEVEYNDTKLFIESFKNSTLFYNSNVPVTSKLYYSYSVPIVDTVAQTANVTDQQDSMIIDLATQVAVMEMMLM